MTSTANIQKEKNLASSWNQRIAFSQRLHVQYVGPFHVSRRLPRGELSAARHHQAVAGGGGAHAGVLKDFFFLDYKIFLCVTTPFI